MKKKIAIILAVALVAVGAFWAKGYYNDRYVASEVYYTQIPTDEANEDPWLLDSDGNKQEKGKSYELNGYDEDGEQREVYFTKSGTAKDCYAPGTYMKVSTSKTTTVGVDIVAEALGVSRQSVSKWENGSSDPNTANLIALAKLYGVSPEELLGCVTGGTDKAGNQES